MAEPVIVRMFVFNNCRNDARVLKEAATLASAGLTVEVVAVLDKHTEEHQMVGAVAIKRMALNPLHVRLFRVLSNPLKWVKWPAWLNLKKSAKGPAASISFSQEWLMAWEMKMHQQKSKAEKFKRNKPMAVAVFLAALPMVTMYWVLWLFDFGYRASSFIYYKGRRIYRRFFFTGKRILKRSLLFLSRKMLLPAVRFLILPFHKYFNYYDYYRQCLAYSLSHPAAVYHCHDLNTLKIGVELKKIQPAARFVYDSHELYRHKNRRDKVGWLKARMLKKIENEGMHLADRSITVGPCIADWLAAEYGTAVPAVILNAPARSRGERAAVSFRQSLNIPEEQFVLVYSGAITFNRGLEELVTAVSRLTAVRLIMMGFGAEAYMRSLKELIKKEGGESKISFFGPVPHAEVATYLSSADCGIAPIKNICLSYYYCSPNKLFEYVQAGLPVLASNFPEMERVVNEFELGYTFNPDSVQEICAVVERMRTDPAGRARFKANAAKAADHYNWQNEEKKLVEIYRTIGALQA